MSYYDVNDKSVKRFFVAVKKEPNIRFDFGLNYEEVKNLVDVVWEGKCTFAEAEEMFKKAIYNQTSIGNRGEKFKSVVLYDEFGERIMQES